MNVNKLGWIAVTIFSYKMSYACYRCNCNSLQIMLLALKMSICPSITLADYGILNQEIKCDKT